MAKLGLIAGSGSFPLLLADAASSQGWDVVVFIVEGEANEAAFVDHVKTIYTVPLVQVGKLIDLLHSEKITDVVMGGKVHKQKIYGKLEPDERTIRIILNLENTADDTLLGALAQELESEGIKLHPVTFCLKELLAPEGVLTETGPSDAQWVDIVFGWQIAKEIGKLDIGQTVVVKKSGVMAIEAIEGTDEAILRGGKLAKGSAVVVKVAKPQQDTRFDMPAVGMNTIEAMEAAKADVLAIEAGWTIILDHDKMLERAQNSGIVVVSCTDPPGDKQG